MPMERMSMRRVREIMRLKTAGVPTREISRRAGVAPATIRLTLRRFEASGLSWPLAEDMTDALLEQRLFANAGVKQGHRRNIEPSRVKYDFLRIEQMYDRPFLDQEIKHGK